MLNGVQFFEEGFSHRRKDKKRFKNPNQNQNHLVINTISPKSENQRKVFEFYDQGKHLIMHGAAGSGKTLLACYLAIVDVLDCRDYNKLFIIRSVVPSREMGFLPGSIKEKARIYEMPYQSIFSEIFSRDDAYDLLKSRNQIEFLTTSFLRGTTFRDAVVVVDEGQNLARQELDTVLTRIGENCRLIVCGDYFQSDLEKDMERRAILDFLKIAAEIDDFGRVEFQIEDICRSDFVKKYLTAKYKLGL